MDYRKFKFMKYHLGLFFTLVFSLVSYLQAQKPNIMLIFADDLGYGDLSCYGQKNFNTPNLDALAAGGIRFTDFYSGNTVCAPSRDSLMTGRDSGHTSVRGNGKFAIPANDITVATLLKKAGYNTGLIGKSCVTGNTQTPEILAMHGFDYFFGTTDHVDGHFRYPKFVYENTQKINFPENHLHHGNVYDLDLYTEKTLAYIDKQSTEKPFLLILSVPVPHAGIIVPADSMARVREGVQPDPLQAKREKHPHYTYVSEPKASYAGLMTRLDDSVGAVVKKLKEKEMFENTLIICTSDNGSHAEGGYHPDMLLSNGVLRGMKRDLYEGGIRVPLIVHWPSKIKAGRVSAHPSALWDILPTACEIAGGGVPQNIQGISFLPTLTGEGNQLVHNYLYWEFHELGGRRALRAGNWKVVQYNLSNTAQGAIELYNLKDDISETNNLATTHPDKVKSLTEIMNQARVPSKDFPLKGLDK
jgi:arylsulfatase A